MIENIKILNDSLYKHFIDEDLPPPIAREINNATKGGFFDGIGQIAQGVLLIAYGIAKLAYGIIYTVTAILLRKDCHPEMIAFGLLDILIAGPCLIIAGIWHTATLSAREFCDENNSEKWVVLSAVLS